MRHLYVHGLGHFHPENVIDNAFLESLDIGTAEGWILERVGIHTRRTVLPLDYIRQTRNADPRAAQEAALHSNAETGRRAALLAIERAGIRLDQVGMVVAGGCSPDHAIPAEASTIAAALGLEVPAFDLNTACSSFLSQLHLLRSMDGLAPFVLVVNPENTTRVIDYRERSTAVLWGDGTSAAVVSTTEAAPLRVTGSTLASSPAGWREVHTPRTGHFTQNGSAVQRFAIKTTGACLDQMLPRAREKVAATGGQLRFVGHQANRLMLEAVARRAELDPESHWHNVARLGNTGAAGAPTVLSEHWDELKAGDVVMMVTVGSGLTWASAFLEVEA